jgi:hypothetical protein
VSALSGSISETPPALELWSGPAWNDQPGTGGTPIASTAYLLRFQVPRKVTRTGVWVIPTVQSGNIDIGVYGPDGALMAHTGSIGCPAVGGGAVQALDVSVTFVPGVWYRAAIVMDNTTVRISSGATAGTLIALLGTLGLATRIDAAGFPLPASLTFGIVNPGSANNYCIYFV